MKKKRFHQLLAKKLSNNISDEEATELEQAISVDEIYEHVHHKFSAYFKQNEKEEANNEILSQIWQKIDMDGCKAPVTLDVSILGEKQISKFRFAKIAALLFLIAGTVAVAYQLTRNQAVAFIAVSTTNHKTFLVLNEGTKIWLNQKSEIRYNKGFGASKREIFLKGEAYFDVVKNQEIPLVVHAGEIDIKVKGTSFNVNAIQEKKAIEVILVSGLIEVAKKWNNNPVLLHANQKLIFTPQPNHKSAQQFVILSMPTISMFKEVGWKNDTLHFNKEKLKDLALKLEKRYNVKINITSAQLKEKRFTGSLVNSSIQQVLEVLKLTCSCGLNYSINNNLIVIKD